MKRIRFAQANIILFFAVLFSGCLYKLPDFPDNISPAKLSQEVSTILKDAPKEDLSTLIKIFRGAASYCNSSQVATTPKLFGVFDDVQEDYGWDKKKYLELNKIILRELTAIEAQKPKPISEAKGDLSRIFNEIADGVEIAHKAAKVEKK